MDGADLSSPNFFPILPWDPYHGWSASPAGKRKNGLESIAACHFNMAGFVLPQDLPRCRQLGLGAIMLSSDPAFTNVQYIYGWRNLSDAGIDRRVKDMVAASGADPSIKGYFISDEPGARDFPALAKAVAAVKKYAPGKLAYINLCPDYATLGAPDVSQLGTSTYTEYLERFVQEVNPQLISYDNYMVQYSMDLKNQAVAASYYANLLAVRRVALAYHLPYLNIVASSQIQPSFSIPSPANLTFQAYTTLAAGYRGVTWYTYFGDFYPYAPLSKSGEKTLTWNWLQEVNHEVAALAPVMSHLSSTGVFFSDPPPAAGLPRLPGNLVDSVTSSFPVMVGEFQHQNGRAYVMVVNLSLEKSSRFTLKTKPSVPRIFIVSAVDGSLSPFNQKEGLWLTAGQGVLLALGL
ncbi:MAG TPA: hypothetical protein VFC44_08655 [Candidatus Saccharimonadales bacterium]|nr:hypothetical protein [Candidatus Saccharimonadales bacterium]